MSSNSATNLKSRLRVVPIDEWSTREKLCLASSVLKSGDQNWSSVSRPLKAFGEPNRPNDWFHQKYCAIQYHDLLEKIETETPKRKRSERGEETPQTIIVKNLTKQRIEELKQLFQTERQLISKWKCDYDLLKNNEISEKRYQEISDEIKEKAIKEKEREVDHKKWLEERELKIAQMSRKGTLHPRKPCTPSTPTTPITPSLTQTNTTPSTETVAKSPLNEPLKVEVDSEVKSDETVTKNQVTTESKLSIALTSPSTSPLLTSLLQSPTPSTPNILSPNKSGLSVNNLNRQKSLTPVSTPLSQITRRPSIHTSPQKTTEDKVIDNNDLVTINPNAVNPIVSTDNSIQNQQKTSVESSKLSKLLETPNTSKQKTTVNEMKETETKSLTTDNKESEQTVENLEKPNNSQSSVEEIQIFESQPTTNDLTKISEQINKNDETRERMVRNADKNVKSKTDSESDELKDNTKDSDKTIDDKSEEINETISIKQEFIESNTEDDKQRESERTGIKEEPMDSTSTTTEEDSNQRTPSNRTTKRTRKTPNPITITPTAMRRSRRVALKDSKSTNDESTEVSDQSGTNTPQTVKKRGSVDDTTETSMSEESMDDKSVVPSASIETVPNSPASVRTDDMDNSKEYRTWKKAIMVNWRLISAHKNASLFSHPVTETEAKGYEDIVHIPMDLNSIKKRVETGVIRNTTEYQRDILLMFQNALMFNNADHDVHKMAYDMQKDTIDMIEDFIETRKHDNQNNESKLRARDRRSNVSTILVSNDNEISGRRKSRGASTDTDSNASGLNKSLTKKKKN